MTPLIEQHREALAEICRRFGVERLYLFGSATDDRFNAAQSDLDFLVLMTDRQPTGRYADRYLGMAQALERLFDRPVDLLTEQSIRNPYLREGIEASRCLIYEQPHEEAVV